MECNRDEAVRAREIANMKLSMEDFYAAKKFVLKARKLFPTLEGLSHVLHISEVRTVAQTKVGGTEMDWYGILQVDPGADKVAIRKQYRKLALFLHPDKNKLVGAEEAFKLVQSAWDTLADDEKRAVRFWTACPNCKKKFSYRRVNEKIECCNCKHNYVMRDIYSTASDHESSGDDESVGEEETSSNEEKQAKRDTEGDTFISACPECAQHYQYLRKYENATTHCSGCKHNFVIRDVSTASGNENLGNKEGVGKKEIPSDKEKRAHNDTERDIFSSACPNCAKQYRYLRKYENATAHCSGCKHNFVIHDIHSTASRDESRGNEQTAEEEILEQEETVEKERDDPSKYQQNQEEECRRADARQDYFYPIYKDPTRFWARCPNCKQYEQYESRCRFKVTLHCPICKHIFIASYENICTDNGKREFTGWFQNIRKTGGNRYDRGKRQK